MRAVSIHTKVEQKAQKASSLQGHATSSACATYLIDRLDDF